MTKAEALKIMDREADRFSAIKNIQYIYYSCRGKDPDLIIRFVDGKIDAYGKEGDFDLTKEPRALINIKTESHEEKEAIIKHEETKPKP